MRAGCSKTLVALGCGGTGGHLFSGLAVAEALLRQGAEVMLLISPKEVDQVGVRSAGGMRVATLPAVGLSRGQVLRFCAGFGRSFLAAQRLFRSGPPQAVLAMGGFTSAPPVLAGKACGAASFLHESNTIPGRANRWLAHVVDQVFVGFGSTATRLKHPSVECTGTPVRSQFQPGDKAASRESLGLDPARPLVLVMGGSQGARRINELAVAAWPAIARVVPQAQVLHLAGLDHAGQVRDAYARTGTRAVVHPFLTEMELALGAATVAVSRAGASSLAELAAMRLPTVLVPYPTAAGNHQYWNARAYADAGAALVLEERTATAEMLAGMVSALLCDEAKQASMREALGRWESPGAAERIARRILSAVRPEGRLEKVQRGGAGCLRELGGVL